MPNGVKVAVTTRSKELPEQLGFWNVHVVGSQSLASLDGEAKTGVNIIQEKKSRNNAIWGFRTKICFEEAGISEPTAWTH